MRTLKVNSLGSVLRSPSFEVLVGRDRICLMVPKFLAKGLLDPLYALMNNANMKESQEGRAIIDDVDADVFADFCEFAYKSDYFSRRKEQKQPEIGSNGATPNNGEDTLDEKAVEAEPRQRHLLSLHCERY
jgi:hypothetical protein